MAKFVYYSECPSVVHEFWELREAYTLFTPLKMKQNISK